ncbi:MAG: molecular chaperone [Nostoc sp. DedSLP03]|uniref:molecular chaperone n=1 Tax=Nostoc sp. DedSLP03 TaxID=3075400 RepID=UPI002AD3C7A6|nr:molecular chaperone [Nostoc sp. DedSLP03]MDZ7966422.1 molecular chaperone [Nostoc sp. DedSLP03]
MPIEIQIPEQFSLHLSDDSNILELPTVKLVPINNNRPHIIHISYSVQGNPAELVDLINLAYKEREQKYEPPLKLTSTQQVRRQVKCPPNNPLPLGANCTLNVKVDYVDSNTTGLADFASPQTATAQSRLTTPGISNATTPQSLPPNHMTPKSTVDSNLTDDTEIDGWLAIDFGTSNSTVTLFDPRIVPRPDELPREPAQLLRKLLAEWLDQPVEQQSDINTQEWKKLITTLNNRLKVTSSNTLGDIIRSEDSSHVLDVICQIELYPFAYDKSRRAVRRQLDDVYHQALRVPPLTGQSLFPVELDETRHVNEIPSELEVISLDPLTVNLGHRVSQNRKQALNNASGKDWQEISGRFHHSPKRYFGQTRQIDVSLDGKDIAVKDLIQAAWKHLFELTLKYRNRNSRNQSGGHFNTVIITYPTIAPPTVREQIKQLVGVNGLRIPNVRITYDEAVSVAIFYLFQAFKGDWTIGIEAFKTRCRRVGNNWVQNVLVLDIGGGTTDIALINLTLEEIDPFKKNEDRGDGGRYYKLIPKLLGASGHLHLGGELLTLRVFYFLKAAITDCLLSAVSDEHLQSEKLSNRLDLLLDNERFSRFLDQNQKFRRGSLRTYLEKENLESKDIQYALNLIDDILPTRWKEKESTGCLQTFYLLWDEAEKAKLYLGSKQKLEDTGEREYKVSETIIEDLLKASAIDHNINQPNSLNITLSQQEFEKSAIPVVEEAIGIAAKLMENRLRKLEDEAQSVEPVEPNTVNNKQQIDWLILSGKTCGLYLVEQEIRRQFGQSEYFVWNPERITFEKEYTKQATSAGACYAENLRQLIFAPEKAKHLLIKGLSQLYIDVKNLFYYLPCAFKLKTQRGNDFIPIFEAGQELELDPKDFTAKYCTPKWEGVQLAIFIYRIDFEDAIPQLWGSAELSKLAENLGMGDEMLRKHIIVKYEIDQTLQIQLLLCRDRAYYQIDETNNQENPPLNVQQIFQENFSDHRDTQTPAILEEDDQTNPLLNVQQISQENSSDYGDTQTPAILGEDGRVALDIAVNVLETATAFNPGSENIIFGAKQSYSQEGFYYKGETNSREGKGIISEPLPPFPLSNEHRFFLCLPNGDKKYIGKLPKPNISKDPNNSEEAIRYYASLDSEGILRIHAGKLPYWISDEPECLREEGCVYQQPLRLTHENENEKRDPFCGLH